VLLIEVLPIPFLLEAFSSGSPLFSKTFQVTEIPYSKERLLPAVCGLVLIGSFRPLPPFIFLIAPFPMDLLVSNKKELIAFLYHLALLF